MNIRNIDLNLLVILDALITERSVTRAAQRLGLTQSAVSHALRRLRTLFGDDLLMRSAGGMDLTARAIQLAEELRVVLAQIQSMVNQRGDFDPATSNRVFRLRVSDYVSSFLLGRLCRVMRTEAPGARLDVGHFSEAGEDLVGDEIHVRLGPDTSGLSKYSRLRVFEDEFVVVMSKRHSLAKLELTLERYVSLVHLKVATSAIGTNLIDDALARRGLKRDIAMLVPSWLDVHPIVTTTDLVAVLPRRWTQTRPFATACVVKRLPIEEVELAIDAVWHPRHDEDAGHAWIRATIKKVMQQPEEFSRHV
jgi:DNA-binding transcriptional LysR family regulator